MATFDALGIVVSAGWCEPWAGKSKIHGGEPWVQGMIGLADVVSETV